MRWWFLALAMACSGGGDKEGDDTGLTAADADTDADTDTDTDADADADTDADTDTDTDTDTTASIGTLQGAIVDASGAAVSSNPLKLCRGLACLNETTDGSGGYAFANVIADWHSFEVVRQGNHATVLVPIEVPVDGTRTLDVVVPELDPAMPMPSTPTEVELGEGLFLTLAGSDIEPPLFVDPATEVAGVRVPQADWIPVDGASEVLDLWYIEPYHNKAVNGGLPIRFANLWKLADGTTYEVWVASYDDSAWHVAGTVTASGDWLEGGVVIDELSPIALVKP